MDDSVGPKPPLNLGDVAHATSQHSPLPMATLEGTSNILRYCNPAFCVLVGKSIEQLIGKPLNHVLPNKDQCLTLLERVFRTKVAESYTEKDPAKPHPVFWSYTIWPVLEQESLLGLMIQVTETAEAHGKSVSLNEALVLGALRQHELTEAAEKLNELLRMEVAERKQAEESAEELSKKLAATDRAKDEFLAMLAHELRNPLMPIKSAAQVLKMRKSNDPIIASIQVIVERQADHMIRLVDDLLDMSRIQNRKVNLHKVALALNSLILWAVDATKDLVKEHHHQLTVDLEKGLPLNIEADPARIVQIISNLIINAVKYTPKGGRIHISTESAHKFAVIRVRDNGIGISPNMLQTIFGLFEQVDVSLDRSAGGLGLGLKLVKELVEMQGGTVEARSEGVGKGSEFIVRFPLSAKSIIGDPAESDSFHGPSRRILLIEDNIDIIDSMTMLMTMAGHHVETAETGTLGLEKACQGTFDVALVDIGLPEMNGYEVAKKIREKLGKKLVLFAMSGYGQKSDKTRAIEAGFNEHLTKPVDFKILTALFDKLEEYSV